jgi:REP element-mobilizing transposase RayT
MARPLRIEFPGAVYHVTARGNARQNIFINSMDYETFFEILENAVERFNWLIHSYCLMRNHYHLVIETPDANLSKGMRHLNGVYTQKMNYRHGRTGHIFQGRYKSIIIDKQHYLLEVCRYVVVNPVRAGFVELPEEWQWSSYRSFAGFARPRKFLTVEWILKQFSDDVSEAQKLYRNFVLDKFSHESLWQELRGNIILGSNEFVEDVMNKDINESTTEISKDQRYVNRLSLERIFVRKNLKRKVMISNVKKAYYNGYTLKEIAEYLGVHYTTVSRLLKLSETKKDETTM